MEKIEANNPSLKSFVKYDTKTDFPIQNLPFGINRRNGNYGVVTAIGDFVVELKVLAELNFLDDIDIDPSVYHSRYLNDLMEQGKEKVRTLRNELSSILRVGSDAEDHKEEFLFDMDDANLVLPVKVGDYTDFYSSIEHATNVGTMFRGKENALKPNWKHLPVGYHGRASSIIVSGQDVHRPKGQTRPDKDKDPVFGPSKKMDFELEVAFVVGKGNPLGSSISIDDAEDYIFGLTMFNDWSARDIQGWEYVPLGPFLGKSFGSTVSPWIVTMDALEPYRVESPEQDQEVLPYLQGGDKQSYDINLEVELKPDGGRSETICKSNYKYMYWTMAQQLAHHTVNGCNMRVGDMCASGTISGKSKDSYGSMLELSWGGKEPLELKNGEKRAFLEDGDTVTLKGYAEKDGVRIGFGNCSGKVLPAI